jgi:hypothetical protein
MTNQPFSILLRSLILGALDKGLQPTDIVATCLLGAVVTAKATVLAGKEADLEDELVQALKDFCRAYDVDEAVAAQVNNARNN